MQNRSPRQPNYHHAVFATRPFCLLIVILLLNATPLLAKPDPASTGPAMRFIDNGQIRLGINLDRGGSITYLALSHHGQNLVNNHDLGRQIQMSFYSGPVPYHPSGSTLSPNWAKLGWNPIQTGSFAHHPSKVVACETKPNELYVKTIPMIWPLANTPGKCSFELWVKLQGRTAQVHCRLNNHRTDKTQYDARSQECPAIYTNAPYCHLLSYTGSKPFQNNPLTCITNTGTSTFPWHGFIGTENWAALVDDHRFGLGVWTPKTSKYLGGFAGRPGKGSSTSPYAGYIAPLQREILDYNIQYDYHYTLIVGNIKQIRDYVYQHASHSPPTYEFNTTRDHWAVRHGHDQGYPLKGSWDLHPTDGHTMDISSPVRFWNANNATTLQITMAAKTKATRGRIYWAPLPKSDQYQKHRHAARSQFTNENSTTFPLKNDDQFHTYHINLKNTPGYTGGMIQLEIAPAFPSHSDDEIKIKSIRFTQPHAPSP